MAGRYPLVTVGGQIRELPSGDTILGGNAGTVTTFSAGDLSPLFTTSEANPTTTPALSFSPVNQNANLVFAGPSSGMSAAPTFRALVNNDLPTVDIAHGGTGQTTAQAGYDALAPTTTRGDILYRGIATNDRLGGNTTTTPQFLRSTGSGGSATDPVWSALNAGTDITAGTLPIARGGTNSTSFTNTRVPYFNGTSLVDSADMTYASKVLSLGESGGDGEIRSYQIPGFYVAVKTSSGKSGIFRSNTDYFCYYDTNTGETVVNATFASAANILFKILGTTKASIDSSGVLHAPQNAETFGSAWNGKDQPALKDDIYDAFAYVQRSNTEVTGTTQAMVSNVDYLANSASLITFTLPASPAKWDVLTVTGNGSGGWKIAQNSGQKIHSTTDTTTGTGGYIASSARYDSVTLRCVVAGASAEWVIFSQRGTITVV